MYIKFSNLNRLRKESILLIFEQIISLVFGLGVTVVLAKFFQKNEIENYSISQSLIGFVVVISTFGITNTINQRIGLNIKRANFYIAIFKYFRAYISFPFTVILSLLWARYEGYDFGLIKTILIVSVYNLVLTSIGVITNASVMTGNSKSSLSINSVSKIIFISILVLIGLFNGSLDNSLILVTFIFYLIFRYIDKSVKSLPYYVSNFSIRLKLMLLITVSSYRYMVAALFEYFILRLGVVLLVMLNKSADVASYSFAHTIVLGLSLIPLAVVRAFYSKMLNERIAIDQKIFHRSVFRICAIFVIYSISIMFFLTFVGDKIILYLYGDKYFNISSYLFYLCFLLVPISFNRFANYILISQDAASFYMTSTIFGALIFLSLSILLIPKYLVYGLLISSFVAECSILFFSILGIYINFVSKKNKLTNT